MERRDVTAVRRVFSDFNEIGADIDAEHELPEGVFAAEHEIVPIRAALESTVYRGPRAIYDFWDASRESWSALHVDLERVEPEGSGVLAVGTLTGTSRETGAQVESRVAWACHLREGLVYRLASHASEESAREELRAD